MEDFKEKEIKVKIIKGKIQKAKKVVVYGPEGIGKTCFAAKFPDPLFIDTEDSTKEIDVARFEKPTSWTMLKEQVRYVQNHPGICKTLVIDTADWAESLEVASLCAEKQWDGIEAPGYGKGYAYSAEEFGKFLNMLSDLAEQGIHIVITAHAQLRKIEMPEEMGAYDHWEMKTSKKIAPLIREWADAVFFLNYKTRVVEVNKKKKAQGGQRMMYTCHTPFWDAKNRWGLPEELPLDYEQIRRIIEATPAGAEAAAEPAAELVTELKKPESKPTEKAAAKKQQKKAAPLPKSSEEPKKEIPPEATTGADAVADKPPEEKAGTYEPDKRIPKALRDMMMSDSICEWDLQAVVESRKPGIYPPDTPVWNYEEGFIHGWILKYWDKVVEFVKVMKDNQEIPFD